jgi:lipoprotein-anchoring transpeptidase ErfK/SrfK
MRNLYSTILAAALVAGGCGADDAPVAENDAASVVEPGVGETAAAAPYGGGNATLTAEELERGRMDPSWKRYVVLDSVALSDTTPNPEAWEDISAQSINDEPIHLPLYGDVAGPSVATLQIALDRAHFSPGIIDGKWGQNTEEAIYWLQKREGLPATGRVDRQTWNRIAELAGTPEQLIRTHRLSEEDVSGPFVEIPDDIYEKAEMECMCYESLPEKLAEMFHTSPAMLEQLNPGTDLEALTAGDQIQVPRVREAEMPAQGKIAKLIISDGGHYVHAVDQEERIVYHFPSTLGSSYDPSPEGNYEVQSITEDPWWHYQPDIIEGAEPGPDARIPPGPNNAVGKVWMDLSKPHYGIHGTSAPETIGYATSAGCVRLTNWDALFLADRLEGDTPIPVHFVDTREPAE